MYVVKAAETMFVREIRTFNVDEVDTNTRISKTGISNRELENGIIESRIIIHPTPDPQTSTTTPTHPNEIRETSRLICDTRF